MQPVDVGCHAVTEKTRTLCKPAVTSICMATNLAVLIAGGAQEVMAPHTSPAASLTHP